MNIKKWISAVIVCVFGITSVPIQLPLAAASIATTTSNNNVLEPKVYKAKTDVLIAEEFGMKVPPKVQKDNPTFVYSSMSGAMETMMLYNIKTLELHSYITSIGYLMEYLGVNKKDADYYNIRFQGADVAIAARDVERFLSSSEILSFPHYMQQGGELYHYIEANPTMEQSWHLQTALGQAPEWMEEQTAYYSFDGIYFVDDIKKLGQKHTDIQAVNKNTPFYAEFMYLPFRTKTTYSATELDIAFNEAFAETGFQNKPTNMRFTGTYFLEAEAQYGMNALLFMGIAINESAFGTSGYAIEDNNLFGYNAVDSYPDNADRFTGVKEGILEVANLISWSYGDASYAEGRNYYGGHLGNKASGMNVRYASDPFWGEKAVTNMVAFNDYLGGLDTGVYTIALAKQESKVFWNRSKRAKAFTYKESTSSMEYMYPVIWKSKRWWTSEIVLEPPFNPKQEVLELADGGGLFTTTPGFIKTSKLFFI